MAVQKAELTCELLTPGRVRALWPTLSLWFDAAADNCAVTRGVAGAEDILAGVEDGNTFVFLCSADGAPMLALAIQVVRTARRTVASILGMGGQKFQLFMHHYWAYILDWLRRSGVTVLYTDADDDRANIYLRRFAAPHGRTAKATRLRLDL